MAQAVDSTNESGMLAALMGGGVSERVKKLLSTYFVANTAIRVGKRIHQSARNYVTYTIAVPSDDDIYAILHEKILAMIPPKKRRSVVVRAMKYKTLDREDSPVAADHDQR